MTDSSTQTGPTQIGPAIDRRMLEALICPQTQASLRYDAERQEPCRARRDDEGLRGGGEGRDVGRELVVRLTRRGG